MSPETIRELTDITNRWISQRDAVIAQHQSAFVLSAVPDFIRAQENFQAEMLRLLGGDFSPQQWEGLSELVYMAKNRAFQLMQSDMRNVALISRLKRGEPAPE